MRRVVENIIRTYAPLAESSVRKVKYILFKLLIAGLLMSMVPAPHAASGLRPKLCIPGA